MIQSYQKLPATRREAFFAALATDFLPDPEQVLSAARSYPHRDFGEGVVAVMVAKPGAALDATELVQTLKSQIAGFKVPKRPYVVDELPRNVMGKVQKNLLRQEYEKIFNDA